MCTVKAKHMGSEGASIKEPESAAETGEDFPEDTAAAFALMAVLVDQAGWRGEEVGGYGRSL